MWGYRCVKTMVKYVAGCASATASSLNGAPSVKGGCIFNYHRVAHVRNLHCSFDDWNVSPETFERQARWLAMEAECVPLEKLLNHVPTEGISRIALSFDDGY